MNQKQSDLRKLRREDLLEMLIAQVQENERLRAENRKLSEQLNDRRILLDKAGSIAQAALELNRVFEAAQAASDQYLENIERLYQETELECRQRLEPQESGGEPDEAEQPEEPEQPDEPDEEETQVTDLD
jgi:regulator of replication initiation timing